MTTKKSEDGQGRLVDLYLGENYNPDVISCLANLSNDEVFTPPDVVNRMLDMLPQELFEDPDATFLDPFCKSGVFLREIAKRLINGLEKKIPDLQERVENIFMRQLFGIAITELTSLLSRRTLYCSKYADSKYSIVPFESSEGNIRFKNIQHSWTDGKCSYCGVSQSVYGENVIGKLKETHAYEFIHTESPKKIFNMKFDVIIGNPPYQMADGGASASASPIYHLFVERAKQLDPRFISMIMPARWYSGGKGLDEFRDVMLSDRKIKYLVDFFDSTECFPGVDISGGICYFLWEKEFNGCCTVTSHINGKQTTSVRNLKSEGSSVFVRFNEAAEILKKIALKKEVSFADGVSSRKPFGFSTKPSGIVKKPLKGYVKIYSYPENGYIKESSVGKNNDWLAKYKVCDSKAYGERGSFPYLVLGKPFICEPGSCCSETYIVLGVYESLNEAKNVISYIKTKFFRFLVLLQKNTQDSPKRVYEFVPMQDFSKSWSDESLYEKYGLSTEEVSFIESMIRPMEL